MKNISEKVWRGYREWSTNYSSFSLQGQRSLFEKVVQFNKNIAENVWRNYLEWSLNIEPFKDIILAFKVKLDFDFDL